MIKNVHFDVDIYTHKSIFPLLPGENSRNQEGIGIGLYLAREIVMKQKGYMKLTTTEKGNQFSIVLYRNGAQ